MQEEKILIEIFDKNDFQKFIIGFGKPTLKVATEIPIAKKVINQLMSALARNVRIKFLSSNDILFDIKNGKVDFGVILAINQNICMFKINGIKPIAVCAVKYNGKTERLVIIAKTIGEA